MSQITTVASLNEYINLIKQLQTGLAMHVFRGQSNYEWSVASGVYRRISRSKELAKYTDISVKYEEVFEYLTETISAARRRFTASQIAEIHDLKDINILVEMQHYGSATNLIDFTFNSLTALYFAAVEQPQADARVFCIDLSNPQKIISTDKKDLHELFPTPAGKFYSFLPNHSNRRIIKQDSLFLFNDTGFIDDSLIDAIITVKAESKNEIIQQLKGVVGITEESVYPDFLGYLQANNASKPLRMKNAQDYYEQALRFHHKKEFTAALEYYQKSLQIDPNQANAHLNLSRVHRRIRNYQEAIKHCFQVLEISGESFDVINELAILHVYIEAFPQARLYFNKAESHILNETQTFYYTNNLAWMYICLRDLEDAKNLLLPLMTQSNPMYASLNLGHCYLLEKSETEAINCYRICLKSSTTVEDFRENFLSDYKPLKFSLDNISVDQYDSLLEKIINN